MSRRSQVKHPRWLPRPLRPTPRLLARARAHAARVFGPRLEEALAIDGFLRLDEGALLCFLAQASPPGAILEIGTYCGKSTVFLAAGMSDAHTLTAVDPQDETRWRACLASLERFGLAERVEPVRRASHELRPRWSRPLSLLWIDGHHGYASVRRDIEDWAALVVPGGHLAFHDTHPRHAKTHGWGVRRAILESTVVSRAFESVLELRNAWFFRRRS